MKDNTFAYEIILASGSPRRKELLQQLGIPFEIIKSDCEEVTTQTQPYEVVMELSAQKAEDVFHKLTADERKGKIILGADTIVAVHDKILGKPKDAEDAVSMLTELSGEVHHVYTGVTLLWEADGKQQERTFYEDTEVEMYPMSEDEIRAYVATGEPMDKAGAYAIQGGCVIYIKEIRGEYNNVVGLPVARLYQELKRL